MGKQPPRVGWYDPPSEVRITVLQEPGDRSLFARLRVRSPKPQRRRPYVVAVLVVVAAVAAIAATISSGPAGRSRSRAREGVATGVAAAYGYPARCLSVTISSVDPAFARADFNHASPCGRYAGYPTAIFHVVQGSWRPVVVAVSYPCPAKGIPAAVQAQLAVCPGATRSGRPRRVPWGHSRAGHAPWAGTDPSVPP
jgi:hypothetical protein